jgi:tetratricopeptide (TPR) repeat protein
MQAADLDPANADALSIATITLAFMQQWSRLEEVLLAARERFSDDTDLASIAAMLPLWSQGDVGSARERYTSVRPNAGSAYVLTTVELPWFEHDFAGVIKSWDRPEVLKFVSSSGSASWRELNLAMAYQQLGETDRADRLLGELVQRLADIDRSRFPVPVAAELDMLAEALALQGEKARAIEIAEEATRINTLESDRLEGTWPLKVLCKVLALTGERDRALEILAQLIDKPSGFVRWAMYLDPRWDFFRDDDRFNELIRPDNLEQSIYAKESSSQ